MVVESPRVYSQGKGDETMMEEEEKGEKGKRVENLIKQKELPSLLLPYLS
jgi:hypothetical protein